MSRQERFESKHKSNSSLNETVVLLYNIVEILALANFDAFVFIAVVLFYSCCVGTAFVNIDQAGFAVSPRSLCSESVTQHIYCAWW